MYYRVLADGIAWVDSDGVHMWPLREANALADHLDQLPFSAWSLSKLAEFPIAEVPYL